MQKIWRLPSPYPSKCGDDNGVYNLFPKPYTMAKCRNTCIFNMMLSKCGDVIQQWQIYLPTDRESTKKEDSAACLIDLFNHNFPGFRCKCPVSCYDMYIDTVAEISNYGPQMISFNYLSNTVTEIKEIPAYPASRFITDIGGWLSLFTGMSVLSLLEVLMSISLSITALYRTLMMMRRNNNKVN